MKLRKWRHKQGLTMKQLAAKLGTTLVSVSRYENSERSPIRGKMVEKIFTLTKGEVTANDLYGITPERIDKIKHI